MSATRHLARRALSTMSTKELQQAVTPSTVAQAPHIGALSKGEQAWCEVYGVEYERQLKEALDEAPLLETDMHSAFTANANATAAKQDIWQTVFGSR